jgi:hypothetical protein
LNAKKSLLGLLAKKFTISASKREQRRSQKLSLFDTKESLVLLGLLAKGYIVSRQVHEAQTISKVVVYCKQMCCALLAKGYTFSR